MAKIKEKNAPISDFGTTALGQKAKSLKGHPFSALPKEQHCSGPRRYQQGVAGRGWEYAG
jgi:hypothetical protein